MNSNPFIYNALVAMAILAITFTYTSTSKASPDDKEKSHLITHTSPHNFKDTVDRLRAGIEKRPLHLFAEIDHSAGAKKADLELTPSTLFIFGNPKGGTPLMQRNPEMGLALPLKMHVYQKGDSVMVTYENMASLGKRYGLDTTKLPVPKIVEMLAGLAGEVVAG